MVATSAHHIVRVTVRIDVASFHRDIDVTLPTSSSFAEILPELARLVDLPEVSRPWEATTVAGAVLDQHRPLYQQRLHDGQVVVLRPRERVAPPVVRDAAETLADAADVTARSRGLDIAAALTGSLVVAVLTLSLSGALNAVLAGAVSACAVAAVTRSRVLFSTGLVLASGGAGMWVAGPRAQWVGTIDPCLGVLAAATVLAIGAGLGVLLTLLDAFCTAALTAVAAMLATAAATTAWLHQTATAAAALVLAGLAMVLLTPGIATRASGIAIPRVPTAGENFSIADYHQPDIAQRGHLARAATAGISLGVCLCCVPALGWLGWLGGGWSCAFALCSAGALLLHSFRHHDAAPRICLALTSYAAVAAACCALRDTVSTHPIWIGFSFMVATIALTAPLWSSRIPDLEPTTLVWFERAEAAALIAVFPLGLHLIGVFDMIRGL